MLWWWLSRGAIALVVASAAVVADASTGTRSVAVVFQSRVVATATDVPHGDNEDLLVWQQSPDQLVFADRRWRKRLLTLPPDCRGQVVAVGSGQALVECPIIYGNPTPPRRFLLIDGRSLRPTSFTTPDPYPTQAAIGYHRIGRYWLEGTLEFHNSFETVFYNWRTRAFVVAGNDHHGEHEYADISTPGLWRQLRSPFRRPRMEVLNRGPQDAYYNDFERDGNWIAAPAVTVAQRVAGVTLFGRCGHPYRGLGHNTRDVELGGDLVTWTEGFSLHILRLSTGKQYTGSVTDAPTRTATDLIFSQPANGAWTILAARIPRS